MLFIASPPTNISDIFFKNPKLFGFSKIVEYLDGVVCIILTLFSIHNLFNNEGVFCSSSLASTNVCPEEREHHISNPKISKLIVVTDTMTLFGLKSIIFFIPIIKLLRFLCVIFTPFGFPVEPDVYIKYANVFGSMSISIF